MKTSSLGSGRSALAPPPFDDVRRSCLRLLEWSAPLLGDVDRCSSRDAVEDFLLRDAGLLQGALERIRGEEGEAVLRSVPYWEDWYLECREPLPVHANPFYIFDSDSLPGEESPFRLAARLALAAASYCTTIDRGELAPDVVRGELLCMKGATSIFRVSRRAALPRDAQVKGSPESRAGRSAVVLSKGSFHLLELISPCGELRPLNETAELLERIAAAGACCDTSPGVLTCLSRGEAARGRALLRASSEENSRFLDMVERALFVLRLDSPCGERPEDAAHRFLFDEGRNAWYEKALQIIVTEDGWAGINFEHSARDGTHMGPLVKALLERAPAAGGTAKNLSEPLPLRFALSPELRVFLGEAGKSARELSRRRRQSVLRVSSFGSDLPKRAGVSPDAFVQLALLLAGRMIWGEWRSAYESVHMRRFAGGRTEGTRPLTAEAAAFLDALCSGANNRPSLRPLLLAASRAHKERIEECLSGRGTEGHLGLLREIWRLRGAELGIAAEPGIYSSPAWTKLTACCISTSTTTGEGLALAGYGPVQRGGLSARYLSRNESLVFHIASWAEDGDLNERFAAALEESLHRIASVL